MNDKDLGKKLLDLDATTLAGVPDARQQTWSILARDRRRVRFWMVGATLALVLAALLIFGGLTGFALLFPEQARLVRDLEAGNLTPAQRDSAQHALLLGFQKGTLMIALSVAVLALFAVFAVFLILASRRATLRQVNAGLVEIAEQLRKISVKAQT